MRPLWGFIGPGIPQFSRSSGKW